MNDETVEQLVASVDIGYFEEEGRRVTPRAASQIHRVEVLIGRTDKAVRCWIVRVPDRVAR